MKIKIFSLIFLCFAFFNLKAVYGKKDTTTFFCNQKLVSTTKKYADYYVKVFKNVDETTGVLQYTKDNILYMQGSFLSRKLKIKEGNFTYFSNSGIKESSGSFENDLKKGIWHNFHENGTLFSVGEYAMNDRTGTWKYFNKNGEATSISHYLTGKLHGEYLRWVDDTLVAKGQYETGVRIGEWKSWYNNGEMDDVGSYKDGKREGEWKFYFESGNIAAVEQYSKGEPTKAEWFDETGNSVKPEDPLEKSPEFPGGDGSMAKHIMNNFEYPEIAREMGEQGTVYIEFKVHQDGSLTDFKVVKSASASIDKEALRCLKSMPKWTPGINHNRKTPIRFTTPIRARLG